MRIVADASALLAILLAEDDASIYKAGLQEASTIWISPVNWWEVQSRMIARYGQESLAYSTAWMEESRITVEPITAEHAVTAIRAWSLYRGSPARLNLGDCFAYALAKSKNVPMLFKGNDFAHTDIEPVLLRSSDLQ